jgi:hypothetical protein
MATIKPARMSKAPPAESDGRSVILFGAAVFPFLKGPGPDRMICGDCGGVFTDGTVVSNIVVKCPWCDTYNDFS